MITGMLWYDNDPTTPLAAKVQKAAEYYRKKYGAAPDACVVNPSSIPEGGLTQVEPIAIRASRMILPGHLWIGREEKEGAG
jgi:hypothetical protein